ncbi:YbaN family protein [Halomonas sp. ML-15]|uniref:YbaN family protein n=1 Tax=Halomonas sp. ML-15 TaxID=2773305 RepID=UPI0017473FBF|nr:YbaN family protein [Halomonas sp. ML-15]MBD3895913.1 YbaN family protein [Halomonas sp. ML-15]
MLSLRRVAYIALAWVSFCLGMIGVVVPLMPTTCFMLLAVWAASRGSPRFAQWIREHPRFGASVVAWERERAIPRRAKGVAVLMLVFSVAVLLLTVPSAIVKLALVTGLGLLAVWIVTRPSPVDGSGPFTNQVR